MDTNHVRQLSKSTMVTTINCNIENDLHRWTYVYLPLFLSIKVRVNEWIVQNADSRY